MKIDKSFWDTIDAKILKIMSKEFVRWRVFIWIIGILLLFGGIWTRGISTMGIALTSDLKETREQVAEIHGAIFRETRDGIFTLEQKKNYP